MSKGIRVRVTDLDTGDEDECVIGEGPGGYVVITGPGCDVAHSQTLANGTTIVTIKPVVSANTDRSEFWAAFEERETPRQRPVADKYRHLRAFAERHGVTPWTEEAFAALDRVLELEDRVLELEDRTTVHRPESIPANAVGAASRVLVDRDICGVGGGIKDDDVRDALAAAYPLLTARVRELEDRIQQARPANGAT